MGLLVDTMLLSVDTMGLLVDTMLLSAVTMGLLVDTMALSADTIISLATFFYGNGSFRSVRHPTSRTRSPRLITVLTITILVIMHENRYKISKRSSRSTISILNTMKCPKLKTAIYRLDGND